MGKHGKKYQKAVATLGEKSALPVRDAFTKVKELAFANFDESVDVSVKLGVDPTKSDQAVRGAVVVPHGIGRKPRVVVFAKGEQADAAQDAGADEVGVEDLVKKIEDGWLDFDYAVATPDMMGVVGKLAKILGPRGLLPNKKLGTVALNLAPIIKDLKSGKRFFKSDKSGLVNMTIGKASFEVESLRDNLASFIRALYAAKPPAAKGQFIRKISVSSTMGVGVPIDINEALKA